MFALLIIPLLVSGSLIVTSPHNIKSFYRLHRYDGQLLYMKVATYGVYSFFGALVVAGFLKLCFPSFTAATWLSHLIDGSSDPKENRIVSWLTLLSVATCALAFLWLQICRLRMYIAAKLIQKSLLKQGIEIPLSDIKQHIRLSELDTLLSEGTLGQLFFDSATLGRLVLVSLKCRKVYVGKVNMISEPNEKQGPNLEISITPIMSGYRDKDTLRVLFSNDYNGLDDVDTSIIFPLSEVSHASWFNMDVHEIVDNNRELPTTD
ncbi:hypothetical protein GBN26_07895 [Plesiomonas shigelloides]|uniref:hypothetical protein n=1 Tax=Plesiomonas shigelloides TaxID=703 RepID=UPI0012623D6D|nr:hypothetical protein [Plesiomonas shigelloides]KAB7700966.1 hypothetical protein GBN26_07895 [Plesiomonas shigelloides]